jgi:hypothetical protein
LFRMASVSMTAFLSFASISLFLNGPGRPRDSTRTVDRRHPVCRSLPNHLLDQRPDWTLTSSIRANLTTIDMKPQQNARRKIRLLRNRLPGNQKGPLRAKSVQTPRKVSLLASSETDTFNGKIGILPTQRTELLQSSMPSRWSSQSSHSYPCRITGKQSGTG